MPINASHEYFSVEKKYLAAKSTDEKIFFLEELIKVAPKHKSSENLLKELRTRLKKLREKSVIASKKKSGKKGIKKEGFQCILIGPPNTGKSSLLKLLSNAHPKISPHPFTTKDPVIGAFKHQGIQAQLVDLPSLGSPEFDFSLLNTADCIIVVLSSLQQIPDVAPYLKKSTGELIYIVNKSDLLSHDQLRKLSATIKSKRLHAIPFSAINPTHESLLDLKSLILKSMHVIRVYTKEPGKTKTNDPIVLKEKSTVKQVAEKILKGFSKKVKETRITGPSSKFPNQKVGLTHVCKDLDIVEFHTK
tara:strand:- start:1837 stop:2748 length:912 start_codon:yes stop_codon:yes gene_type:complete